MIIRVLREFHGILTSVTGLTKVRTYLGRGCCCGFKLNSIVDLTEVIKEKRWTYFKQNISLLQDLLNF